MFGSLLLLKFNMNLIGNNVCPICLNGTHQHSLKLKYWMVAINFLSSIHQKKDSFWKFLNFFEQFTYDSFWADNRQFANKKRLVLLNTLFIMYYSLISDFINLYQKIYFRIIKQYSVLGHISKVFQGCILVYLYLNQSNRQKKLMDYLLRTYFPNDI